MKEIICVLFFVLLTSTRSHAYQPGKFYSQGKTQEKLIALTFDDGPGPFTPKILNYLKQHNIRATFFMEGDQLPAYAKYAKQVQEAGHEIGNHTYNHLNFNLEKNAHRDLFVKELDSTEAAIEKATGVHAKIVRMPYGASGKRTRPWLMPTLKERGDSLVHWTFGTDWFLKMTSQQMADAYIKNAHPGAVFLMHDGGRHREKTFEALQIVVPALEKQGYRFVAAEDFFKDN